MNKLKKIIQWVRFGTITERVTDTINGTPCEIEYVGRWGRVVGFWAYGSFDPSYPYHPTEVGHE